MSDRDVEVDIYVKMPKKTLGTFKLVPIKEWEERYKPFMALAEKWRKKSEKGNHPSDREIGWVQCADDVDALVKEMQSR